MQDRFKFRVWDKENNKYIDFEEFKKHNIEFNFDVETQSIWIEYDKSKYVLQQSTGLKDKNGKLIYEGDIVRLKAKNGMTFDYAVKYKNYCFILEYINGKLKGTKARDFAKQYAQPKILYEHGYMIIGNIYKNPELLED